jgi:DNA-binding NtrC family response regulator
MRLPIAGTTEGELSPATKLAIGDEESIAEADAIAQSGAALRSARGASAETVTRVLVGLTVADVERDLILETLKHCLGNRTRAAAILGISIRTLRNKLNEYAGNGVPVPPPGAAAARPAGC